jgi:hypothetical protein
MTEVSHDFPQSLQANAGIVPQIRPLPLPFMSFPIHYPLTILSFDAVWSEMLTASLNKPHTLTYLYATENINTAL